MSFSIDVYHKNMLNNIKIFMKIMLLLKKRRIFASISNNKCIQKLIIRDGYMDVKIMFRDEITVKDRLG